LVTLLENEGYYRLIEHEKLIIQHSQLMSLVNFDKSCGEWYGSKRIAQKVNYCENAVRFYYTRKLSLIHYMINFYFSF